MLFQTYIVYYYSITSILLLFYFNSIKFLAHVALYSEHTSNGTLYQERSRDLINL
jgi:hypothetical protein